MLRLQEIIILIFFFFVLLQYQIVLIILITKGKINQGKHVQQYYCINIDTEVYVAVFISVLYVLHFKV